MKHAQRPRSVPVKPEDPSCSLRSSETKSAPLKARETVQSALKHLKARSIILISSEGKRKVLPCAKKKTDCIFFNCSDVHWCSHVVFAGGGGMGWKVVVLSNCYVISLLCFHHQFCLRR